MDGVVLVVAALLTTLLGSVAFRFGRPMVEAISRSVARLAPRLAEYELRYRWRVSLLPLAVSIVHVPLRPPLDDRISELVEALAQATTLFEEIENDLGSKQRRAAELQSRAEEYERLAAVNAPQAEQLLASMRELVEESSAGSNRWTTLNTLVGIVLSLILSVAVGYIFYRLGLSAGRSEGEDGLPVVLQQLWRPSV